MNEMYVNGNLSSVHQNAARQRGCSNKVAGIVMLALIIICAIVVGITDDGNLVDCKTGGCMKIGGG